MKDDELIGKPVWKTAVEDEWMEEASTGKLLFIGVLWGIFFYVSTVFFLSGGG